MKEHDEIREKEVTTGKQLLEKLSLQQGQNPTEYEHFKGNAGYLNAYMMHILDQLKRKQEMYARINQNRKDPGLEGKIRKVNNISRAFSLLGSDTGKMDQQAGEEILQGLHDFKKEFLGKNERQQPLYRSYAIYQDSFSEGIDQDTFLDTVSQIGDVVGLGFGDAAEQIAEEPAEEIRADVAGGDLIAKFTTSANASTILKLIEPYHFYSGQDEEFKKYQSDLKKEFQKSSDNREKEVLHALIVNMELLEDLRKKHQAHFEAANGGGDIRYRQDLLIQMDKVLTNIQMLHQSEAQNAPRNSFLRKNTTSFGAPEYSEKYRLEQKEVDYQFNNTYSYFKNDNNKAKEQFYYRTQPLSFEVPAYANPKIAALYLALERKEKKAGKPGEISAEISAMRANLRLLVDYPIPPALLSEDDQVNTGLKMAASKLYKAARELDQSIADTADALEGNRADQQITKTEEKLKGFIKTLDEIKKDYRDMPEVVEKLSGLCGSFLPKWQTLNLTRGISSYLQEHKDVSIQQISSQQYSKKSYEMYDDDLYFIARDQVVASMPDESLARVESQLVQEQERSIKNDAAKVFLQSAIDNSGLYKKLKGTLEDLKKVKATLDEKARSGEIQGAEISMNSFLYNSSIIDKLQTICQIGEAYQKNKPGKVGEVSGRTADDLQSHLQGLQRICRSVNKRDRLQINALLSDKFKRNLNNLADKIDTLKDTAVKTNDPLVAARRYVYTHTGNNMPYEGDARTQMAANALSAYIWIKSAEKVGANEKKPVFSVSKIEEYGRTLMKNPIFKAAVNKHALNPSQVVNLAKLHDHLQRPFSQEFDQDLNALKKMDKALKSLKELGSILDHDKGDGKDYQAFFKSLKKLENMNLDYVPADKKCELMNDIYHCTEKFMKGRKSTRFFKESREHFEQCLDVLAIFKEYGGYGEKIADALVDRTNEVRRSHWFQKEVTLEGRCNAKTRKRLMELRKVQKTEKADAEIELRDKAIDKEGLIRANEDLKKKANHDKLKDIDEGGVIDVEKKKDTLMEYLENAAVASPVKAGICMTQMLALSVIPAYKDKNGRAVIKEAQFQKACSVMQDHEITKELADKYRFKAERKELLKEKEPLKKLRSEFDAKNKQLIQKRKLEDAAMLGEQAKGLSYEQYKQACEDKRKQEKEAEKEKIREKQRLKKQQLKDDKQMDKEYIGYLDRITAAKKITTKRRLELLVDYYVSGNGERPVPEEDLQQVQQMANEKQKQNDVKM